MRLAVLIPSLVNQGPVIVARDIVHNLLAEDLETVHVYYFDATRELDFQVPTFRISMGDAIPFDDYDVIHSHMLRPDYYIWKNRRRIQAPCVTTLHNYVEPDLRYRYNWLTSVLFTRVWKMLVSRHDKVVALSRDMQGYYASLYGLRNITYIYNGRDERSCGGAIDIQEQRLLEQTARGKKTIGAVALLTKRKGIDQLVRLLALDERYVLMVIGTGQEEVALKELARGIGVFDRCIFLGYKSNAHDYFKYIDIYAMPSISEGFPLALIEAASFSKPVVCSDIPVFREIFAEDDVSFFTLHDIKSLHAAVEKADRCRESYSLNIYNKYKENYTAKIMAARYHELYQQLSSRSYAKMGS